MFRRWFRRRRASEAAGPLPASHGASPGTGLTECPECRSDCVFAEMRCELDDGRSWMRLRCGQCDVRVELVIPQDLAARLEADIARGRATIAAALSVLELERMAAEADVFAAALQCDLIDASDFAS